MATPTKSKVKSLPVLFLRDTSNKASASFTIAWLSFNVVFAWLILYIFGGIVGVTVPDFDAAAAVAFLSPTLGLYFLRRQTEKDSGSLVDKLKEAVATEDSVDDESTEA